MVMAELIRSYDREMKDEPQNARVLSIVGKCSCAGEGKCEWCIKAINRMQDALRSIIHRDFGDPRG